VGHSGNEGCEMGKCAERPHGGCELESTRDFDGREQLELVS